MGRAERVRAEVAHEVEVARGDCCARAAAEDGKVLVPAEAAELNRLAVQQQALAIDGDRAQPDGELVAIHCRAFAPQFDGERGEMRVVRAPEPRLLEAQRSLEGHAVERELDVAFAVRYGNVEKRRLTVQFRPYAHVRDPTRRHRHQFDLAVDAREREEVERRRREELPRMPMLDWHQPGRDAVGGEAPVHPHHEHVANIAQRRHREGEGQVSALVAAERLAVEPHLRDVVNRREAQRELEAVNRRRVEAPLVPGGPQLVAHTHKLVVPTPWDSDRRGVGYAGAPAGRAAHVVGVEPDRPHPGEVVGDPEPIRLGTQEPHACSLSRAHQCDGRPCLGSPELVSVVAPAWKGERNSSSYGVATSWGNAGADRRGPPRGRSRLRPNADGGLGLGQAADRSVD